MEENLPTFAGATCISKRSNNLSGLAITPLAFMKSLLVPLLLVSMHSSQATPFLVAHRGASGDAPENTLPAFELAWKQGADAIEGDFHLTKDGKIVCFHDFDTKKRAGKKLVVKDSTLADLQALDVGAWKDKAFTGTLMPTLLDVLATVPDGKAIYIEVKCGPEIVPALLEEVAQSNLKDEQIVIISFKASVIEEVKKVRPQWKANWLYSFDKKLPGSPMKKLPEVLKTLRTIKADGLSSNSHHGIKQAQVDDLQSAGFEHHVWTVNDAATAQRFRKLGTASITTDYPGALRKVLAE